MKRTCVPTESSQLSAFSFWRQALRSTTFARKTQNPDVLLTPQTATLIINEYLADPPGSTTGELEGDANGDGFLLR